jgi:hypothetical protein
MQIYCGGIKDKRVLKKMKEARKVLDIKSKKRTLTMNFAGNTSVRNDNRNRRYDEVVAKKVSVNDYLTLCKNPVTAMIYYRTSKIDIDDSGMGGHPVMMTLHFKLELVHRQHGIAPGYYKRVA